MQKWMETLHPLEIKVLHELADSPTITSEILINQLGYGRGQANQALSWLEAKGVIEESDRQVVQYYELTSVGALWRSDNPAVAMRSLAENIALSREEMAQRLKVEPAVVGKIFGQYSREGILGFNKDRQIVVLQQKVSYWDTLQALLERAYKRGGILFAQKDILDSLEQSVLSGESKKRGSAGSLFRFVEKQVVSFSFLPSMVAQAKAYMQERRLTGDETGSVTSAMLKDGSWREKSFRRYNMKVPITRLLVGRRNAYGEYLESVKDKLANLGFHELDGPLIETEFWNNDALFMPQFHPARDIHDVYSLREPKQISHIEEPFLTRVAQAHEQGSDYQSLGWRYSFDRDFTRRLILRSQGTVLSAKQLPKACVPSKYFGIVRCFRRDQVDATHGADFYQIEGIVVSSEANVCTLLDMLYKFAFEFTKAQQVKCVPAYFPFTEPSFEVHAKHPVLGWFELGGGGLLRPEVTQPLGVKVPVMAWGLGLDRMALLHLGLSDLRELFTHSIDSVRLRRGNYAQN